MSKEMRIRQVIYRWKDGTCPRCAGELEIDYDYLGIHEFCVKCDFKNTLTDDDGAIYLEEIKRILDEKTLYDVM